MLNTFLSYAVILPAAVLCYMPMKGQFRCSLGKTAAVIGPLLIAAVVGSSLLAYRLNLRENDLLLPFLAVSFLVFHCSLKAPLVKTVATFSVVAALMSILANIAAFFSMAGKIKVGMGEYAPSASLAQICLSVLAALLLGYPFLKYGKLIIDQPSSSKNWYGITLFSAALLTISIALRPVEYKLLNEGELTLPFMTAVFSQLAVWVLALVIFYSSIAETLRFAQMESRAKMLEMQEKQYVSQQRYIRASEKTRHDFRHSVRMLTELYDAGNTEAIGQYLHQYASAMPASEITAY